MNCKEYMNIIFCESFSLHLSIIEKLLDKNDVTSRLKSNQLLHELIAAKYIKADTDEVYMSVHNSDTVSLVVNMCNITATAFSTIDWRKNEATIKNEYQDELQFSIWVKPWLHCDFLNNAEIIPVSIKVSFDKFTRGEK